MCLGPFLCNVIKIAFVQQNGTGLLFIKMSLKHTVSILVKKLISVLMISAGILKLSRAFLFFRCLIAIFTSSPEIGLFRFS